MSVAKFVRGLDLNEHSLNVGLALNGVGEMVNLEWIRLDHTKLSLIPEELFKLRKLKRLTLSNNQIDRLATELANFVELEKLAARRNVINDIPESFFRRMNLHTLVLSHNDLKEVPELVHQAKELRSLSLAYNGISELGPDVCRRLTNLTFLDLSGNLISNIPPQFRRLDNLEVLILANNPLGDCSLKSITRLKLRKLDLSKTLRNHAHFPVEFQDLKDTLVDLDISMNDLGIVPAAVYALGKLQRLHLGFNKLTASGFLPSASSCWPDLETLNLTGNEFDAIPLVVCHMRKLKRLYLNENRITESGFPTKLARLSHLHTLMLSGNRLETLPRFVCLMALNKFSLRKNELTSLPVEIHLLLDNARLCDITENPFLRIPPKPRENVSHEPYYGADFSLEASEQYAARLLAEEQAQLKAQNDLVSAKVYKKDDGDAQSRQLLKAMVDQAGTQQPGAGESKIIQEPTEALFVPPPPKNWQDSLVRPDIDYSSVFASDVGTEPGLEVFIIASLNPKPVDASTFGQFCVADCYIVLSTKLTETGQLTQNIHYWIGEKATIDKRACAAIHAVNLRNLLGSRSKDERQVQGEETDDFRHLFLRIEYVAEDKATESGLYRVSLEEHPTRLFILVFDGLRVKLDQVEPKRSSLVSKGAFILETKDEIFVWQGAGATLQSKAKIRLMAQTVNSNDYKSRATVTTIEERDVNNRSLARFYKALDDQEALTRQLELEELAEIRRRSNRTPTVPAATPAPLPVVQVDAGALPAPVAVVPTENAPAAVNKEEEDFIAQLSTAKLPRARRNTIYRVVMGHGYLELPQIYGRLMRPMLEQDGCFIIDTNAQIFVWVGRKTGRDLRLAAQKLTLEIFNLIPRPKWAKMIKVLDRAETEIFKKLFDDWEEIISVDHSRRVGHVSELVSIDQMKMDVDVRAVYKAAQRPIDEAVALRFIEQSNARLEAMNCFIFDGRKFKALPVEEKGVFFSEEVYAFLCMYRVDTPEEEEDEDEEEDGEGDEDSAKPPVDAKKKKARRPRYDCVLYYWEGRTASPMGWLNFKFQFQKTMENLVKETYKTDLKIVRTQQQKEPVKLLAHFDRKVVIHTGPCVDTDTRAAAALSMYQVRHGAAIVSLRAIQVAVAPKSLASRDCFFIRDNSTKTITMWVGHGASRVDENIAKSLLPLIYPKAGGERVVPVYESQEPPSFWLLLGGQASYDRSLTRDHQPLQPRLFRCSNATGAFKVIEIIDFCQDDLSNDDVMLLDPGAPHSVFFWIGSDASSVEVHMARRAVEVYLEQCRDGRSEATHCTRVARGNEPIEFKGHFHGWSDAVRQEQPLNEFLRTEKLVTGHVVDENE